MRTLGLFPIALFTAVTGMFGMVLKKDFGAQADTVRLPQFELPPLVSGTAGLKSKDLLGGKLKVVNVFASWCGACQYQHPVLMQFATDTRLVLVGIDWKDDAAKGAEWIARNGNPYRMLGDDATGGVAASFGVTSAPEILIVDAQGQVRYRHTGPLTSEIWSNTIEPVIAQVEAHS